MKLTEKNISKAEQKARIRRRYQGIDPNLLECIPGEPQIDYYDDDIHQRVAIYVRVSTGDPNQTSSYELQKKYYEEFVIRHPNWTLVKIYADEGISGTSLNHITFELLKNKSSTTPLDNLLLSGMHTKIC